MFNLNLDEEEKAILNQLLENCLEELHNEIIRTENLDYKKMLKKRKEALKKLQASLQEYESEVLPDK